MVVNSSQGGGSKDTWVLPGRGLMLSRIADSLFWIARYIERAEDTARILDVNYYMMLEGAPAAVPPALGADLVHRRRPRASSSRATPRPSRARCFEFLGFSEEHPDSIVQCVAKARENARTIRDRISREMWEDLNSLYLEVSRFSRRRRPRRRTASLLRAGQVGQPPVHGRQPRDVPARRGLALPERRPGARARRDDRPHRRRAVPHAPRGAAGGSATPTTINGWRCSSRWRRTSSTAARTTRASSRSGSPSCCVLHPQHPRSLRFSIGVAAVRAARDQRLGRRHVRQRGRAADGRLYDSLKYDRIEDIFARGLHPFLAESRRPAARSASTSLARTSTTRWGHEPRPAAARHRVRLRRAGLTRATTRSTSSPSTTRISTASASGCAPADVVTHGVARLLRQLGASLQRHAEATASCASRPSRS